MPAIMSALQPIMLAGAFMLASPTFAPAAEGVPRFNVAPGCRSGTTATVTTGRDEEACKADEEAARTKLEQEWGGFTAAQRGHCVRLSTLGGAPSYVELLTCLEIAKSAADLPATDGVGPRIER